MGGAGAIGFERCRRRMSAAGFRRYDEILPHPPGVCGSMASVKRVESPVTCGVAPPAIGPRDVPPARRKMRAGRGMVCARFGERVGFTHPTQRCRHVSGPIAVRQGGGVRPCKRPWRPC